MSWRDDLRPASYRGVAFHVMQSSEHFGRKTVLHRYPLRNKAYLEDLGRDVDVYELDAFVIGNDYMAQRDALKAALLQSGRGELVHPYYGTLQLSVLGEASVTHSVRDGGMAWFRFALVDTDDNPYPDAAGDTRFGVASVASWAEEALGVSFAGVFDVLAAADFVASEAVEIVGEALSAINGVAGSIISAGSELTSFIGLIEETQGAIDRLLQAPATLAQKLTGAVDGLLFLNSSEDTSSKAYRAPLRATVRLTEFGTDLPAVPQTTPSRAVQAANQQAVVSLVRRSAVIAAARAAADIDFTSYNDAVATRDELAEIFEKEIVAAADAGDDVAYEALAAVRGAMVADITQRGAPLSRLGTYTPPLTMPVLVIAHRLYGDASRADEIAARNGLRHPGFVPGGEPLEVLVDD